MCPPCKRQCGPVDRAGILGSLSETLSLISKLLPVSYKRCMGYQTASFFPPLSINSDMSWKKGEMQHSPHSESLESSETYKQKRTCKPILDSISRALTRPLLLLIIFSCGSVCGWEKDSGSLQVLVLQCFSIIIHLGGSQPPSPFAEDEWLILSQTVVLTVNWIPKLTFLPTYGNSSQLRAPECSKPGGERGAFLMWLKGRVYAKIPFLSDTQA